MKELNKTLEVYFVKKAPALPKNIKDVLVKLAPWGSILMIAVAVPGLLALLGLSAGWGTMMGGWSYGGFGMMRFGGGFSLAVIFLVISAILEALAIPGLFKKKMMGWNYLYYAMWVNAVYNLLTLQIVSLVIGLVVGLYFLFQVRSYYK